MAGMVPVVEAGGGSGSESGDESGRGSGSGSGDESGDDAPPPVVVPPVVVSPAAPAVLVRDARVWNERVARYQERFSSFKRIRFITDNLNQVTSQSPAYSRVRNLRYKLDCTTQNGRRMTQIFAQDMADYEDLFAPGSIWRETVVSDYNKGYRHALHPLPPGPKINMETEWVDIVTALARNSYVVRGFSVQTKAEQHLRIMKLTVDERNAEGGDGGVNAVANAVGNMNIGGAPANLPAAAGS